MQAAAEYEPAAQSRQLVEPVVLAKVPAVQLVQEVLLYRLAKVPVGHSFGQSRQGRRGQRISGAGQTARKGSKQLGAGTSSRQHTSASPCTCWHQAWC